MGFFYAANLLCNGSDSAVGSGRIQPDSDTQARFPLLSDVDSCSITIGSDTNILLASLVMCICSPPSENLIKHQTENSVLKVKTKELPWREKTAPS